MHSKDITNRCRGRSQARAPDLKRWELRYMDKRIETILSRMKSRGQSYIAYTPLADMAELLSGRTKTTRLFSVSLETGLQRWGA